MFDVTVFPVYKRCPGYKITTSKHHRVNKFYVTVLHFISFELFTKKIYGKISASQKMTAKAFLLDNLNYIIDDINKYL